MWSQVRITKVPSFLTFFFHSVILWEQLDPGLDGLVEAARRNSLGQPFFLFFFFFFFFFDFIEEKIENNFF